MAGRGKRKIDMAMEIGKRAKIEQDLDNIEQITTSLLPIDEQRSDESHNTSELYKALRQPPMDSKIANAIARVEIEEAVVDARNNSELLDKQRMDSLMDSRIMSHLDVIEKTMHQSSLRKSFDADDLTSTQTEKSELMSIDEKIIDKVGDEGKDVKEASGSQDQENWLAPSCKKQLEGRNDVNISNVQVMDEETRMSAESSSTSQTPARSISIQGKKMPKKRT